MTNLPIVWVEIGRKSPPHLLKNIALHEEMWPEVRQILLTDSPKAFSKHLPVEIFDVRRFNNFSARNINLQTTLSRTTSQVEFWIRTTSRFLILEEFANMHQESFIHLESDCVILYLDPIIDVFKSDVWDIAYPLQANEVGCASILLVKNSRALTELCSRIMELWNEPNMDDMRILGDFARSPRVRVLPSSDQSEFLYDPQTFGRYLLGTDARNCRYPFASRGQVDTRLGAPTMSIGSFFLVKESSRGICLAFGNKERMSQIVNLHIHSKRVPDSRKALLRMLRSDIKRIGSRQWYRGRIDVRVLMERLGSKVFRIAGKNRDFRLR